MLQLGRWQAWLASRCETTEQTCEQGKGGRGGGELPLPAGSGGRGRLAVVAPAREGAWGALEDFNLALESGCRPRISHHTSSGPGSSGPRRLEPDVPRLRGFWSLLLLAGLMARH